MINFILLATCVVVYKACDVMEKQIKKETETVDYGKSIM